MLYLDEKHKAILFEILSHYDYKFYAFGSRITGKHKAFSDIDLCFKEPIPDHVLTTMAMDFEESDLPFKVDLVDYQRCNDAFKKRIDNNIESINQ